MTGLRFASYPGEYPSSSAGTLTQDAITNPKKNTTLRGDDFADIAPHRCNHQQPKNTISLRGVEGNALTHNAIKKHPPRRSKGEEALVIH